MPESKHAVVLGCGLVGAAMVRDLAREERFRVDAVDVDAARLESLAGHERISPRAVDLSSAAAVRSVVASADVVIGALPSTLGLATLRTVIEAGKPYCDISFMPEDGTQLDGLARENGVTAVLDCGVAPGLANMLIGHAARQLEETHDVLFYVGGLPKEPQWPYLYKAPFAPSDVIEEYTRPARFVENGQQVTRPALSDAELIDFPRVGTLEAFNTDGLRSLLKLDARNIREKTLRWPGHVELMRVLRETGFFDKDLVEVEGSLVRPLDVTARLLFPKWQLGEDEVDFTLLQVYVSGVEAGRSRRFEYTLYDEYDPRTGEHSMARTTGYPCTLVARLLVDGRFHRPGVHPPEALGRESEIVEHLLTGLAERGVRVESA